MRHARSSSHRSASSPSPIVQQFDAARLKCVAATPPIVTIPFHINSRIRTSKMCAAPHLSSRRVFPYPFPRWEVVREWFSILSPDQPPPPSELASRPPTLRKL
jgi:hypothetical protein